MTLTFHQAQEVARAWCQKSERVESGQEEPYNTVYSVTEVMNAYLENYKVRGKAYQETHATIKAHIIPALGSIDASKLSPKKITEWFYAIAAAPPRFRTAKNAKKLNTRVVLNDPEYIRRRRATANRILSILKAGLNFAWRQGMLPSDTSWRRVSPFRNVAAPVIRYLTEDECIRLIQACPSDFRRLVQGALFTGCRYGELCNLTAGDYNPYSGTIVIRFSKNGKPRHVVLNDQGKKFFAEMTLKKTSSDLVFTRSEGQGWKKSHQSRPILEACQQAEITPAISFHILRHTHGSFLAMAGVPLPVIAQQLGHKDTRMTEKHYAHLSPSYVAETIRNNLPVLRISGESPLLLAG